MGKHAPGTIWRRALKRCNRRRDTYIASRSGADAQLLVEAVRTANRLAYTANVCGPLATRPKEVHR